MNKIKYPKSSGYIITTKEEYKKGWKANLKNPFVVIKYNKDTDIFTPKKTFKTMKDAKKYVKKVF